MAPRSSETEASGGTFHALTRIYEADRLALQATCVFCAIAYGVEPATVVHRWPGVLAIVPLNPVVDGHLLVLPVDHVQDAREDPDVTAAVMRRAAMVAPHPSNIITSVGEAATQTVFHLHLHVVPRAAGDGLALPWHTGRSEAADVSG